MEGLKEEKELSGTRLFLNGLKSSLRNLVTERTTKVKENKSKITLTPHFLKEYGKNIYHSMSAKEKKRVKEYQKKYREAKKS